MEKFAVDLDRVLDEFEFNEDCAEQVATNVDPPLRNQNISTLPNFSQSTSMSRVQHDGENSSLQTSVEKFEDTTGNQARRRIEKTTNIRKNLARPENVDSINDFYNRGRTTDDKIQEKRYADFHDPESVSLTIRNDISQKLVQKRQNESSSIAKNHNSYDKKLNQPKVKPSVSNVFSSLNDYINAPSGNIEDHSMNRDSRNLQDNLEENHETQMLEEEITLEGSILKNEEAYGVNKFTSGTPKYQNIIFPVKLDSSVDSTEVSISTNYETISSSGIHEEADKLALAESKSSLQIRNIPESMKKNSENSVIKMYENVDVEIGNFNEIPMATCEFESPISRGSKHVYENVDFEEKLVDNERKTVNKERIYPSEETNILSTNLRSKSVKTQREIATGFSTTIDDLSEDELNKYLADLEAEEMANEGKSMYANVGNYETPREDLKRHEVLRKQTTDDEDANEAPIFETVTIGVLPDVSDEELQEKAKKFPVIDYGQQAGSSASFEASSNDFLDSKVGEFAPVRNAENDAKIVEEKSDNFEIKNGGSRAESLDDIESGTRLIEENLENEEIVETNHNRIDDSRVENLRILEQRNFQSSNEDEDNKELKGNLRTEDMANSNETKNNARSKESTTGSGSLNLEEKNGESNVEDNSNGESRSELPNSVENGIDDDEALNKNEESEADDKPSRPQTLDIVSTLSMEDTETMGSLGATLESEEQLEADNDPPQQLQESSQDVSHNSSLESDTILGKQPPFWIPDNEAPNCMLCDVKFTVIKRRHHCRACGKVLCNKCCSMKYKLQYQGNIDSRVCSPCYLLLVKAEEEHGSGDRSHKCPNNSPNNINCSQGRQPNPNNPMEYCSTIPPLQQLAGGLPTPPTVMVPVGVLKREGSSKQRPEGQKSVMFSDGIRPGCDLTELDTSWDLKPPYRKIGKRTTSTGQITTSGTTKRQNVPPLDPNTNCYIPHDSDKLPPTVTIHKGQISYHETISPAALYKSLKNECEPPIMFAINRNLYAYVKITNLNCCVNRICWNVTSRGLACVGQDEIILLVEALPDETQIPKDLLVHINQIYIEAIKGNTITELGVSIHQGGHFLGSREHAGFLFIRQTFQCLQKIILPPAPFLVGLLVHRWETPWAKVFPLRLMLRLGAEYRYYPCPLVSVRLRDAVYFEIGHTIMKVLADFRNFAYTLPGVRGMTIHMQDRTTDVLLPKNRYDQVIKGLNNSNDHVLAFASNFSVLADSHLVCIQTNTGDESSYQTQAINIHNKPRKVTGASFVVINGALKTSMGLSAKSSIVEDGLMVQIMPEKMEALKASLKNMQDFSIGCGLQGAPEPDETVNIKWVDNDVQFNLGVKSPIDGKAMDGIPSIRVHNGTDYMGTSRFIRWTEVFIIKADDHPAGVHDPVDINKLSESIARATCAAFVKLLDLLATAGLTKLAVRTTIFADNVGYEAGSEGTRLPPIYMNSLDNELIQVLHKAAQSSQDTNTVLELVFHVLDD